MSLAIRIIYYVLFAVAVVVAGLFYFNTFQEEELANDLARTNMIVNVAYIFLGIALVVTLGFSLFFAIMNPKTLIKTLALAVGVGILVFIAYSFATDTVIKFNGIEDVEDPAALMKRVGTGLHLMYILFFGAIASILVTEIIKSFR
jgi:hypothetical protein